MATTCFGPQLAIVRLYTLKLILSTICTYLIIIIIIIIIIFINWNLVITRWQWLFYMYTNMKKVTRKLKSGGLHEKHVVATWKLGNHLSIRL